MSLKYAWTLDRTESMGQKIQSLKNNSEYLWDKNRTDTFFQSIEYWKKESEGHESKYISLSKKPGKNITVKKSGYNCQKQCLFLLPVLK